MNSNDVVMVALGLVGIGVVYVMWQRSQTNASNEAVANADNMLYQTYDEEQAAVEFSQMFPQTTSNIPPAQGSGTLTTTPTQTASPTTTG